MGRNIGTAPLLLYIFLSFIDQGNNVVARGIFVLSGTRCFGYELDLVFLTECLAVGWVFWGHVYFPFRYTL